MEVSQERNGRLGEAAIAAIMGFIFGFLLCFLFNSGRPIAHVVIGTEPPAAEFCNVNEVYINIMNPGRPLVYECLDSIKREWRER